MKLYFRTSLQRLVEHLRWSLVVEIVNTLKHESCIVDVREDSKCNSVQ